MRKNLPSGILLFLSFVLMGIFSSNIAKSQVKFGVFADCQYCDCETAGNRFYRNSLVKLSDCIHEFNAQSDVDFVVGMGDLIDRDISSFDSVNRVLKQSTKDIFHVVGNHDYEVEEDYFSNVPEKLNLQETYYSFSKNGWQFIFLNGNEITFQSNHKTIVGEAEEMVKKLTLENKPNNKKWNGGISETQIKWLENQLREAEKENLKSVIFCHYPLLPLETHTLWNSEKVLKVISNYGGVKAWINGHNHAGNYTNKNGIHFINLKGMVDTEKENAYATISLSDDAIEIEGFGREISRNLQLK